MPFLPQPCHTIHFHFYRQLPKGSVCCHTKPAMSRILDNPAPRPPRPSPRFSAVPRRAIATPLLLHCYSKRRLENIPHPNTPPLPSGPLSESTPLTPPDNCARATERSVQSIRCSSAQALHPRPSASFYTPSSPNIAPHPPPPFAA
ncbi:hypothetical protein CHC_T00008804001 [Chondrus crispus]|uniref:Uncharacterized protein n=1 Tax=Chondrus crispus TaxID=2769 RepID=R7QPH0_CHOCR|nr:hypothetical protein CHC_T00008804001 [Chondrus crispus]CDF39673.1 hypothetical protein CHC_T00008804001 [Chondrus crispus]|eukprot:XP_005709967.1 hypothetical protein CHC_T00008804001 [Chondrus crispus]